MTSNVQISVITTGSSYGPMEQCPSPQLKNLDLGQGGTSSQQTSHFPKQLHLHITVSRGFCN